MLLSQTPFYQRSGALFTFSKRSTFEIQDKYLLPENVQQIILDNVSKSSKRVHGTMVAGLIISRGDGHISPGGTLPDAKILSIQAGTDSGMSTHQLAVAIKLAVKQGAKVINISEGTLETNQELESSVKYALSKGVIIVASAGNENLQKNDFPAAYPGVIAVSALTKSGEPGFKTNYSPDNIFVPGEYLLTTTPSPIQLGWLSGTSAATPLVSSLCVIISSQHPNWNSFKMKSILLMTGRVKTASSKVYHILDVKKSINFSNFINDKLVMEFMEF